MTSTFIDDRFRIKSSSSRINYGRAFEDLCASGFYWYGRQVGRRPRHFLIASLILTCILAPGISKIRINLDLYKLFVPIGAPVKVEFERSIAYASIPFAHITIDDLHNQSSSHRNGRQLVSTTTTALIQTTTIPQKFPSHSDIVRVYVIDRNHANLLQSNMLTQLYNYTVDIMQTTQFTIPDDNQQYTFDSFCKRNALNKCSNDLNIWLKHAEILFRDDDGNSARNNPNFQLSYPVMYLFNRPKDIGNVIFGVNVTGEKHEIIGAKVLTLHWQIEFERTPQLWNAYLQFRRELDDYWNAKEAITEFQFVPHNEKAMDDELRLIIETSVPYAIPVTISLMLFVVLSNVSRDRRKSKPFEAYMGVISVCLSLICTFGFVFYFGLQFNPVCSTMPFLILAVGVDDAFLLLSAWRISDPKQSLEHRMASTMADAGASITVTTATDFGCFALGYFLCATPAVADYCLLTAIGILFDYLFQVTFFISIMVIGGRHEDQGGFMRCCYRNQDENVVEDRIVVHQQQPSTTTSSIAIHDFFRDKYAPFIIRRDVKIISWIGFLIYFMLSIYGCANIKVDISPRKYIRDDSPIQQFLHLADLYIWADNVMPTFHVMRPPDFRDAVQRTRFNELIYRLEHTDYSIGRVSTNLWVWQYQQFLNDFRPTNFNDDFYNRTRLYEFFNTFDYQEFRDKVKFKSMDIVSDNEPCIEAFTFQTSFYGLNSWDKRQAELFYWRRIIGEYAEFDIFLSGIFSPFLIDQRRSIAPSAMQSIGSALVTMSIIAIIFLPDKTSVFYVTLSLLSISMGVCGFLQIWGSDLDSVSMGCIVMAIGLAVDFSVHICYRYHRSSKTTPSAKLIDTLEVVGWPVLQAALSTLFGLASLPLIHAYLVRVFFQTVVLVNVIGLLHGLLWLPQMISSLDRLNRVPIRVYCQQQQQIECDKNREKACKLEEEVDTEEEQRPHEQ